MAKRLSMKLVKEMLPKRIHLSDAEWDENLEECLEEVENSIHNRDWSYIDEQVFEWEMRKQWDAVDCIMVELRDDLYRQFESNKVDVFYAKHNQEIQDEIYERDESSFVLGLAKHTKIVFYYRLDVDILQPYDDESVDENCKIIGEFFGIDPNKKEVRSLAVNAPYGGDLTIFFVLDGIEGLLQMDKKYTKIKFSNPNVAVVDRMNGSGHDEQFKGVEITLDLDWTNIRIDKNHRYSYTYDVCGMSDNWCDGTDLELLEE